MPTAKKTTDSPRVKVIVERKYDERTHRIFAQTMILKNGVEKLTPFKIPVKVEVELPMEIIQHLKSRKVAKFEDGKQVMVSQYIVEKV